MRADLLLIAEAGLQRVSEARFLLFKLMMLLFEDLNINLLLF
jgi:hypothetical protein